MKLSTRARYGARALLDLATHNGQGPVLLKDVARRQGISLTYLEQLMAPLISAGLVRSTRGPRGGVQLARPPEEVRLIDVVRLFEGSTAPVECVDCPGVCPRSGLCVTRDVWIELERAVSGVLENTTIRDLLERQEKKMAAGVASEGRGNGQYQI